MHHRGRATGSGRGTAIRLAEEGAKVVIGDFNIEGAREAATFAEAAGKAAGGRAVAAQFDMVDESSVSRLIRRPPTRED